ncbi:MAG: hypothetical protein ACFFBP_04620 [Promethearchaeota archaeon]
MAEKGFEPLTSQLGIAGTSYRLQLGMINDKWASRILKGREVIDSYVYKEEDAAAGGIPNSNLIVGWVLRTVAIPNINPHQIMKTTQALVKQAIQKKDERKMVPSVAESKEVELEKVPESEIRRTATKGWVKEEGMKTADDIEDEKRRAFQERVKAIKEEKSAPQVASTVATSRKLPSIPAAGTSGETASIKEGINGVECSSCGQKILYCPFCGKKLPH